MRAPSVVQDVLLVQVNSRAVAPLASGRTTRVRTDDLHEIRLAIWTGKTTLRPRPMTVTGMTHHRLAFNSVRIRHSGGSLCIGQLTKMQMEVAFQGMRPP